MENNLIADELLKNCEGLLTQLDLLDIKTRIDTINKIKLILHEKSPFKKEPTDCILWVPGDSVYSNDYNPNIVAPPEMRLLKTSILKDGYTQPIVAYEIDTAHYEIIDGFNRNRVGKEDKEVNRRIMGYLPLSIINHERKGRCNRIAATIRHNRARGRHRVVEMSKVVKELVQRKWSNDKIAKHLGMESDEVLRLKQVTGLADLFKDREFSKAWEAISKEQL